MQASQLFKCFAKKSIFKPLIIFSNCSYAKEVSKTGLKSNIIKNHYLNAINSSFNKNKVDEALETFESMKQNKLKPPAVTYAALIKGLAQNNRMELAYDYFNKAIDIFLKQPNDSGILIFSSMIEVLCGLNNIEEAEKIFNDLKLHFTPTVKTYTLLIYSHIKKSNNERVIQLLDEMALNDVPFDAKLCNSFVEELARLGDYKSAHMLIQTMQTAQIGPTIFTFSLLLRGMMDRMDKHQFSYQQNVNEALEQVRYCFSYVYPRLNFDTLELNAEVSDEKKSNVLKLDSHTLNYALKVLIKCGQVSKAERLFNILILEENSVEPSVHLFTMLIYGLSKQNRVNEAMFYLELMKKNYSLKPSFVTLSVVMASLAHANELTKLNQLLAQVKQDASFTPDVKFYTGIIHGLNLHPHNTLHLSLSLFYEMIDASIEPDLHLLDLITRCVCEKGNVKLFQTMAQRLFKQFEHVTTISNDTFAELVQMYKREGMSEQMLQQDLERVQMQAANTRSKVLTRKKKFNIK